MFARVVSGILRAEYNIEEQQTLGRRVVKQSPCSAVCALLTALQVACFLLDSNETHGMH